MLCWPPPDGSETQTLGELIRSVSGRNPHAPFLLDSGGSVLSYGGLWEQVQSVESAVRSAGFGSQSRIAGVLPNGPEAAVAFLSFAACSAYAPLNPDESAGSFESTFARLMPSAVVVQAGYRTAALDIAVDAGLPVVELIPLEGAEAGLFRVEIVSRPAPSGDVHALPDDLALLLPTSGTTSEPKLVMHTHRTLLSGARFVIAAYSLSHRDRNLNMAPLFHVLGLFHVLNSAASGGSVICAGGFDPRLFFHLTEQLRPTWFSAVPAVLQSILQLAPEFDHVLGRRPFRFFRSAGAPLTPSLAGELELALGAPLTQVYAMSESPPITIGPLPPAQPKPGSVGKPAGPDIAIWDDHQRPLPPGKTGQVVVRGPNVAIGYFNNPNATRDAFRDGWFLTGDLGCFDEDGFLFLTGRVHELINRGGEKISPGEVEDVYRTHPGITEALAFGIPDDSLGEEVALAVVPMHAGAITAAQLRRFGASRLAFHKIPRRIFFMNRIPIGPTGKPNRSSMRETVRILPPEPAAHAYVAPRTDLEKTLAGLWAETLRVPHPGIHDHFFDSGGDSLSAVRFLCDVSESLNLDSLPAALLVEAPTIAEMAVLLSQQTGFSDPDILPLESAGARTPLFLVGAGLEVRHLVENLGGGRPVFSLPLPPPDTIEAMAGHCLASLRRFHPSGPYLLGGWCASGVIAFEMGRRLEMEGEPVRLLALFDARTVLPIEAAFPQSAWIAAVRLAQKVRFHFARWRELPASSAAAYAADRVRGVLGRFWRTLEKPLPSGFRSPDSSMSIALRAYRPGPYSGRIAHFWAADRPRGRYRDLDFEWGSVAAGAVTLYEVPGDHVSMFQRPNVATFARLLGEALEAVDSEPAMAMAHTAGRYS